MATYLSFQNLEKRDVVLHWAHLDECSIEALRAAMVTAPEKLGDILVVTSAADGQHKSTSLHYTGRAWDLRVHGLTRDEAKDWAGRLRKQLHGDWQVFLEEDHLHLERDK